MKRILYIGNHLGAKGKTATTIDTLSENLRKEGFVVFTASSKENEVLRLTDMLMTVFSKRKHVDWVLIDTYSTKNFWYAYAVAVLCKKLSLPYIPVLHGGNLPQRLKDSASVSKFIFGNAHLNIAPSNYLFAEFKKAGFFNLKYIPNTLEIKKYPFLLRKEIKPKLLWVRSFAAIYNPILALEVLQELIKTHPDAKLCMVGPEKDGLLKKCNDYAEKHNLPVTFTRKLEKKEWISLSKNYDIFINTTNFDNTPVSVMEAMALGLPVISTNVGGLSFLIQKNVDGILVSPESKNAFISEIKNLIESSIKAKEIAVAARSKAENFDWEIVKEKWIDILR